MSENDYLDNYCGVYRKYHENGKLKSEVFMNNGKKEGIYKSYYYGQLWVEVNYIDGKMNGIYKKYNDNGQLCEE